MSEPASPPPGDPNAPREVLAYRPPPKVYLPIGVQALLGTVATGVASVVSLFAFFFLCGMSSEAVAGSVPVMIVICSGIGAGELASIIYLAVRLQRTEAYRGWAIGIWIGLGLSALFWGTCGLILFKIGNNI